MADELHIWKWDALRWVENGRRSLTAFGMAADWSEQVGAWGLDSRSEKTAGKGPRLKPLLSSFSSLRRLLLPPN